MTLPGVWSNCVWSYDVSVDDICH